MRSSHRDFDKINCADFHLIAAAPELLEALEMMAEYWQNGSPVCAGSEVAKDAIAAIAKARGV